MRGFASRARWINAFCFTIIRTDGLCGVWLSSILPRKPLVRAVIGREAAIIGHY